MDARKVVADYVACSFMRRLRQPWLSGFAAARQGFISLGPAERNLLASIVQAWLPLVDAERLEGVNRECIDVQAFHIAMRRSKAAPMVWLEALEPHAAALARPELMGRFLAGSSRSNAEIGLRQALEPVLWAKMGQTVAIWRVIPRQFRDICVNASRTQAEPPAGDAADAELLAWIDGAAEVCPVPDAEVSVAACHQIDEKGRRELLEMLIEAYAHVCWWEETADHLARYVMAPFAMRPTAVPDDLLNRMADRGITQPRGLFSKGGQSRTCAADGSWVRNWRSPEDALEDGFHWQQGREALQLFHDQGIALVQGEPHSESAVIAPARLTFRDSATGRVLIVLLEIDLTRPEVAFLQIPGQRLRICTTIGTEPEPVFTKVDGQGNVELYDSPAGLQIDDDDAEEEEEDGIGEEDMDEEDMLDADLIEPARRRVESGDEESSIADRSHLVAGRPLYSPFEGSRHYGHLGATYRLGGSPLWGQDAEFPLSPVSGRPMRFIGQVPGVEYGQAYAFMDVENMIAAVVQQVD